MTIIKRKSLFPTLKLSFDDLLNRFDNNFFNLDMSGAESTIYNSDIESEEVGGKIKYYIDLPGVKKEGLSVIQEESTINIVAERKDKNSQSKIETSFTVSKFYDQDKLEANLSNGVLTISFPKKELSAQPKSKKIEVKILD